MEEEELKREFLSSTVSSADCCSANVLEQNVTARGVEIYVSFSRVSSQPACLGSRWQALARAGGKTWKRRDCSASRERERERHRQQNYRDAGTHPTDLGSSVISLHKQQQLAPKSGARLDRG